MDWAGWIGAVGAVASVGAVFLIDDRARRRSAASERRGTALAREIAANAESAAAAREARAIALAQAAERRAHNSAVRGYLEVASGFLLLLRDEAKRTRAGDVFQASASRVTQAAPTFKRGLAALREPPTFDPETLISIGRLQELADPKWWTLLAVRHPNCTHPVKTAG